MVVFGLLLLLFMVIAVGFTLYALGYGVWWIFGGKKKVQEQRRKELEWLQQKQKRQREREEAARQEQEKRIRALQIADVDNMGGLDFEHYVAKLLGSQGYQARVTKASGDLGVDILAEKGGITYAVQVKRQINQVSRRSVSDAVAGKIHYQCNKAMVITNNYFSVGARQLAQSTSCELVDRDRLIDWIITFQSNLGLLAEDASSSSGYPVDGVRAKDKLRWMVDDPKDSPAERKRKFQQKLAEREGGNTM